VTREKALAWGLWKGLIVSDDTGCTYPSLMVDISCDVFFSHSGRDREWVQHLAHQASASGVGVYLAEHDVRPGENLSQKVIEAIERCDATIVLISKNSLQSPYVQQEIGVARRANKLIIPILMDEVAGEDLGMLNGIEYIPLNPVTPGDALARLSIALSRLQDDRHQQALAASIAKQNRDEAIMLAGALVMIVGLIILSQGAR
jgi:hypothetical protein